MDFSKMRKQMDDNHADLEQQILKQQEDIHSNSKSFQGFVNWLDEFIEDEDSAE